jgi:hypothetical protein
MDKISLKPTAAEGSLISVLLIVFLLMCGTSVAHGDDFLGKIVIKAVKAEVNGQEFTDQELEDSVTDLKRRAKKFVLVEDESEADFLLVVVKREKALGNPSFLSHRTPRNVSDLLATLSVKLNGKWRPGVMLSSNACCKYWTDAANRVLKEAENWIKDNKVKE